MQKGQEPRGVMRAGAAPEQGGGMDPEHRAGLAAVRSRSAQGQQGMPGEKHLDWV